MQLSRGRPWRSQLHRNLQPTAKWIKLRSRGSAQDRLLSAKLCGPDHRTTGKDAADSANFWSLPASQRSVRREAAAPCSWPYCRCDLRATANSDQVKQLVCVGQALCPAHHPIHKAPSLEGYQRPVFCLQATNSLCRLTGATAVPLSDVKPTRSSSNSTVPPDARCWAQALHWQLQPTRNCRASQPLPKL